MVFHDNSCRSSVLVENGAEIDLWWSESYSVDREAAKNIKLNRKDLVSPRNFNGDAHSKLFKFILGRVFVLLDQVLLARLQN